MYDGTNQYLKAFKRLPERFRKTNNEKLYYVLYGGFDDLVTAFDEVVESRNIDKAYGKTLDYLGENVGQFRQDEDDELYRNLIKVRIIANLSIGDIPVINEVLSILIKDVYLGLQEAWYRDEWDNEPAAISINLTKYTTHIPYEIIDRIKAAGVRVFYEVHYGEKLIYKEKSKSYLNPFYITGTNRHKTGQVFKPMYAAKRVTENINLKNRASDRSSRYTKSGERKGGKR